VPTRSSSHVHRTALTIVVLLLALLATMSVRQPDKLHTPQFWAEDGPVFYLDAENLGAASIVRPYNGYWHLYPRTVALIGTKVPVRHLPTLYVAAAMVMTVCALLALVTARLSEKAVARAGMVAAVLLVPFSDELWLTLTNTQWFGALVLVAMLAAPAPTAARGAVAWSLGGIVIGLSGPFALLLSPCAALRAWWHRDRWSGWVLLLFSACAATTMLTLIGHPRGGGLTTLPQRLGPLMNAAFSHPLALLAAITGSLVLLFGLVHGVTHRHWALTACTAAGLLVTAGTAATVPIEQLTTRYVFVPWAVGAWVAIMLAERGYRVAWLVLAAVLIVSVANLRLTPLQPYPWARDAECLEREEVCAVTVNPSWQVGLPGRGGGPR
jgi:hypothetical protein